MLPRPDAIFVPLGSGGTAAGLAAGMAVLGWETRIVAVRVTDALLANLRVPLAIADRALRLVAKGGGPRRSVRPRTLEVEGRYFGGRYGRPTREGMEAEEMAASLCGVKLDQTYTAKAMAALIGRARAGELRDKTVLFWHTYNSGGLPG
jgi:D-cysteine desulfhydrase